VVARRILVIREHLLEREHGQLLYRWVEHEDSPPSLTLPVAFVKRQVLCYTYNANYQLDTLPDFGANFSARRWAAEDAPDGDLLVRHQHVEEALAELLVAGGALTHSLLGVDGKSRQA
jgi:hypothetical protein